MNLLFDIDNNTGIWTGTVTDANNGGFIGIQKYTRISLEYERLQGLEYKMKTSSSTTKSFRLRSVIVPNLMGITWATSVDVRSSMTKVHAAKQVPTLFAR
jgi:hypothetical protein